ncbi:MULTISPECIES: hypothetical protein [unclassified Bradyrhizobium]|uniref:hypothetical protein n=1 Tax=unclassified Bradyrhizobium TaxID=2631580 RepID=UPI002915F14B|nr:MULTISPECIES: hypothetical protein [unclassified Bradyrhizobium]
MANKAKALNDLPKWSTFYDNIYTAAPSYEVAPADAAQLQEIAKSFKTLYPKPDSALTRRALTADRVRELFQSGAVAERAKGLNIWHIEEMLGDASIHFEKAYQIRQRIDSLKVNAFQSLMDLWEFCETDQVHADEIEKGRYAIDGARAESEVKASSATIRSLEQELGAHDNFLLSYSGLAKVPDDWWKDTSAYDKAIGNQVEKQANLAGAAASPLDPGNNQVGKGKQILEISLPVLSAEVRYRLSSALAQHYSIQGARDAAEARLKGQSVQANYYSHEEEFQLRRVNINRKLMQRKLVELYSHEGSLNHFEQITELSAQLEDEFLNAASAMLASSLGLRTLFNYPRALDGDGFKELDFVACLAWVRDAISWLRRIMANDQTITIPVVIKNAAKPLWTDDGTSARWRFELGKDGPGAYAKAFFAQYEFPRIKGISAFFEQAGKESLSLQVAPPQALGGKDKSAPILIGRVGSRDSNRSPIVGGMDVALNTSPEGPWEITIFMPSGSSKAQNEKVLSRVGDIYLDIFVTGHLRVSS